MVRVALLLALLALLAATPQDDDLSKARALVQKLRSESLADRDDARKALIAMGKAALPALREALRDPDAEVARIASTLIGKVEYLEKLTSRFRKHLPEAEARLVAGGEAECLDILRDATRSDRKPPLPFTRTDLDPLVGPALRAPMSDEEFGSLCETIRRQKFKSAAPELRTILRLLPERADAAAYTLQFLGSASMEDVGFMLKGGDSAHWTAAHTLESIGGDEARKVLRAIAGVTGSSGRAKAAEVLYEWGESRPLVDLFESEDTDSFDDALEWVCKSGAREAIPSLVKILETPARGHLWDGALVGLRDLRAAEGLPAAVRLLTHEDEELRSRAAELLLAAGSVKEAAHVAKLLRDSSESVLLIGMKAAAAWNSRECIPRLRELARHPDSDVRIGAVEALGALNAREALPDVLALLKGKVSEEERTAAVKALVALNARETVPAIAECMGECRHPAVPEALRELGARDQIPALVARLGDPSAKVRLNILGVFSEFRWSQTAPDVAKLLSDPDAQVQEKAVWTLYLMQAVDQAPAVERHLEAGGASAYAALVTLGNLDPVRALPHMRRALGQDDLRIRNSAIFWLALRGDAQGSEALEKLASDPGDWVNNVRDAILQLPPEPRSRLASKFLTHLQGNPLHVGRLAPMADAKTREKWAAHLDGPKAVYRVQAISLLLQSNDPTFVPRIRALIDDPEPAVRGAALSSLAAHGHREIAAAVRDRLFDIDITVRLAAVAAVESLNLTEAVPELEELLVAESHDWMPTRVAGILGRFKSRSSVPHLRILLKSPDPYNVGLRTAVLHALRQIGDPAALPEIAGLLNDPKPEIRSSAASTLMQMGGAEQRVRIEKLLRDPDAGVRLSAAYLLGDASALEPFLNAPSTSARDAAAIALVKLGSPVGVPRLLQKTEYVDWYPLTPLNAVRRPDEVSRLRRARFTEPLRGPVRDVVLSQLTPLGIRLDESGVKGDAWERIAAQPTALDPSPDNDSPMYLLDVFISHPFEYVIEKDCVRVVTTAEAREFWRAWWAERQKK